MDTTGTPPPPVGGGATCVEIADADAAACQAVSDLTDATECESVQDADGAGTVLCTYTAGGDDMSCAITPGAADICDTHNTYEGCRPSDDGTVCELTAAADASTAGTCSVASTSSTPHGICIYEAAISYTCMRPPVVGADSPTACMEGAEGCMCMDAHGDSTTDPPPPPVGGGATCVEIADADAAACQAVSDLTDATECESVTTAADAGVAACHYTAQVQPQLPACTFLAAMDSLDDEHMLAACRDQMGVANIDIKSTCDGETGTSCPFASLIGCLLDNMQNSAARDCASDRGACVSVRDEMSAMSCTTP